MQIFTPTPVLLYADSVVWCVLWSVGLLDGYDMIFTLCQTRLC